MKAMILAAGFGTRLMPLTAKRPKVLMPVVNRPVIGRIIDYLKAYGVTEIVVNAHHHYQQILDYLTRERSFGLDIEILVEPEILGTGGGIKNSSNFWDNESFIVINGDILTSIDLAKFYEYHQKSGSLATLILHNYEPFNQIRIDNSNRILEISQNNEPGRLAFTGIHIMKPEILSYIPDSGYSDIINCYRQLIRSGESICGSFVEGHYWRDIGNVSSYISANREMLSGDTLSIGKDAHMAPSVGLKDWAIIGEGSVLEKGVEIKRSILWDNIRVRKGIKVIDSIVTSLRDVENDLIGEIY